MPSLRLDACSATSCSFSTQSRSTFRRISSRAMAAPVTPAPMSSTSGARPARLSSVCGTGFGCLCAAPGHVTSFTVYQRLLGLAARRPTATTPSQSSALPRSTSTPRSTTACTRPPNRFFSARFIFLSGIRIRLPFAFLPILSVGQPTDFFRFQDSTRRRECQCTVCTGNVNFL